LARCFSLHMVKRASAITSVEARVGVGDPPGSAPRPSVGEQPPGRLAHHDAVRSWHIGGHRLPRCSSFCSRRGRRSGRSAGPGHPPDRRSWRSARARIRWAMSREAVRLSSVSASGSPSAGASEGLPVASKPRRSRSGGRWSHRARAAQVPRRRNSGMPQAGTCGCHHRVTLVRRCPPGCRGTLGGGPAPPGPGKRPAAPAGVPVRHLTRACHK